MDKSNQHHRSFGIVTDTSPVRVNNKSFSCSAVTDNSDPLNCLSTSGKPIGVKPHLPFAGVVLACLLLASCGGGGDSTASQTEVADVQADGEVSTDESNGIEGSDGESNVDTPIGESADPNAGDDSPQSDSSQNDQGDVGSEDDGDDLSNAPDTDTDIEQGNNDTDPVSGSVLQSGAVARLLIKDGMDAVGVEGGRVLGAADIVVASGGGLAFTSRVSTPGVNASSAQERLFGGRLDSLQSVLGRDTVVQDIRAGFQYNFSTSHAVASNGTVATIAQLYREDTNDSVFGGESSVALIIADADGAKAEITLNDKVSSPRSEIDLTGLSGVTISNAGVAFLGRTSGAGAPNALFVADNDGYRSVVEDGNGAGRDIAANINGCRVQLARRQVQQAVLLDSGDLIFNASIDGGNTSSPCPRTVSAVMMYRNDELTVMAREGEPVPGSDSFVFGEVVLQSVLRDGSVVIESVVVDTAGSFRLSDHTFRKSYWLIDASGGAKLIMAEGELFTRSDGESTLDFGNVDTGLNSEYSIGLRAQPGGLYSARLYERGFSPSIERLSIHTGQAVSQPHESLHAPGVSALKFLDEIYIDAEFVGAEIVAVSGNEALAVGFAEEDRFLRIGDLAVDSKGSVYFHARVMDSNTLMQKGDYVFKRDSAGLLSVLISPLDRIRIDGRDELLLTGVLGSSFGLSLSERGFSIIVMDDDSLVLKASSTVQIVFP